MLRKLIILALILGAAAATVAWTYGARRWTIDTFTVGETWDIDSTWVVETSTGIDFRAGHVSIEAVGDTFDVTLNLTSGRTETFALYPGSPKNLPFLCDSVGVARREAASGETGVEVTWAAW